MRPRQGAPASCRRVRRLLAVICHCRGLAVLLALMASHSTSFAAKTDIIMLDNGAKVIGEIKSLRRGLLEVATDNMGTIKIEWDQVLAVTTRNNYSLETDGGRRSFGTISTSADNLELIISDVQGQVFLAKNAVVNIQRVKDSFLTRWDGSISLGGSAKKANSERGLVASLEARYRTHQHFFGLSVYSSLSDRSDSAYAERHNLSLLHSAFIVTNWYSVAAADFEHNTELRLKLRSLLSGGASYRLIESNRSRVSAAAGLTLNEEQYFFNDLNQLSAEAFANLTFDFFKYRTPKMDTNLSLTVFPSITESNRYRTSISATTSWEMIKDFWFDISGYYIADSNPPSSDDNAEQDEDNPAGTDWGLDTSIKWKF